MKFGHPAIRKIPAILRDSDSLSVIATDLDGKYIFVNDYFVRHYSLTNKVLGDTIGKFLHPDDIDKAKDAALYCIENPLSKKEVQLRKPVHSKTGVIYSISRWDFCALVNDSGKAIGILAVGNDLALSDQLKIKLKTKEKELLASEEYLRAILSSTKESFALLSEDGVIIEFNKALDELAVKIFGKKLEKGKSFFDFTLNPKSAKNNVRTALKGIPVVFNSSIPVAEENKYFEIGYTRATDQKGAIIGVCFNAIDITKRKTAQDDLIKKNEELKMIAWNQSHVFRRPLANILGLVSLANFEHLSTKDLLEKIKSECDKLDDYIHHLTNDASS